MGNASRSQKAHGACVVAAIAALVLANAACGPTIAAEPVMVPVPPGGQFTVFATSPSNMGEHLLGRPVDAQFQPFAGTEGASLFPDDESSVVEIPVDAFAHRRTVVETVDELAANASAWGIASADIGAAMSKRYASYRAYQVEYILAIDDSRAMRTGPAGATYYLSAIYFGHRYEMVFVGDETSFHAGVKADFLVASGSVDAWARRYHLEAQFAGRGMTPVSGSALFAGSPEEIENEYQSDGDPVPIFVEYRTIPRAATPGTVYFPWAEAPSVSYDVSLAEVRFTGDTSTCVDKVRWQWPAGTVGAVDGSSSRRAGCVVVQPNVVLARGAGADLAGVQLGVGIDDYEWINQYWNCAIQFTQEELDEAAGQVDGMSVTRTCQGTMVLTFRIVAHAI
jgi:hypothetical protein